MKQVLACEYPPSRRESTCPRAFGPGLAPSYESRSSRSSRRRSRIRLLSALIMAAARSRLVFCNSRTFSSTVSRAISL